MQSLSVWHSWFWINNSMTLTFVTNIELLKHVSYLKCEVCIIIICEGVLRTCFVARCLCSCTTSTHTLVIRDPQSPLGYLSKCQSLIQSVSQPACSTGEVCLIPPPPHFCWGALLLWLIDHSLLWQGFSNKCLIFVWQFTQIDGVVNFYPHEYHVTLAQISKHSYLINGSSLGNLHT